MGFFSIITVSFNSGDRLLNTIKSVLDQSWSDYEIIVKDGLSTDSSLQSIDGLDPRIHIYSCKDSGIYDAMNQAIDYAVGDYLIFMNCGDYFYTPDVLSKLATMIRNDKEKAQMYYGDVYVRSREGTIHTQSTISDYNLINRTICHQAIVYRGDVFQECRYDLAFRYAADMAHYVRCVKKRNMCMRHLPIIVVNYEGGGASENLENKKRIIFEKKQIMKLYLSRREWYWVEFQRIIKLKVLKERISVSRRWIGVYEWIASLVAKAHC